MKAAEKEKAKIIKESLLIVDKIGKFSEDDEFNKDDIEKIIELIKKARRLVNNRYWKLY